jgi:hypothetical protein
MHLALRGSGREDGTACPETTPIKIAAAFGGTATVGGMVWLFAAPHSTGAAVVFAGGLGVTFVAGGIQKAREIQGKRAARRHEQP